jgi:threonine/homoserine/homoserine lactone efflux protein
MIDVWLPQLAIGWGVQLLGVLSPGPGVALILSVATSRGRVPALTTCLGIGFGAVVLATLGILGLSALLADVAWAMMVVKLAGAAFLAWLAWKSFSRAFQSTAPLALGGRQSRTGHAALIGFTMQITNPKAIVYWIAAISVAGLETAPLWVIGIFLAGAFANSFLGHGLWAVALSSRSFLGLYQKARRWIEGVLGGFFAFAAFKLATSRI